MFDGGSSAGRLIEAEQFDNPGGWITDTEFIQTMGSPYLMAHGLGCPVADATTVCRVPETGKWRVWVRTMDWVARWGAQGAPGRFEILIDGRRLPAIFGTGGADWHWQDGGVADIGRHAVQLALHDLTGFNGRCDAIYLARDLQAGPPPNQNSVLPPWRRDLLRIEDEKAGDFDLVVAGGGYAGMSAALSAARAGLQVALVQDRPVLGGNASSEIRVPLRGLVPRGGPCPALGTVVEELQYDQAPDARQAVMQDDERCERILRAEKNITLLLNHCLYGVTMDGARIKSVKTLDVRGGGCKIISGRYFADCTGHAVLGAEAGAEFMIGVADGPVFHPSRRHPLMGMTNMRNWQMSDSAHSFPDVPWALNLALRDIPERNMRAPWSWESGFYRHPVADLEYIRDWNLRAHFGAWRAMKNRCPSGQYANARITHLAAIGGPRESRRLKGDYVLGEEDMLNRLSLDDGLVPVTWYLDRHFPVPENLEKFPQDPFLGKGTHKPGTRREARPRHEQPWWGVPYRCLYSRNIDNLFMAGRNISTSYWALGAVRVMRTCGMMGEVAGAAAAACAEHDCTPRDVYYKHLGRLKKLLGGKNA